MIFHNFQKNLKMYVNMYPSMYPDIEPVPVRYNHPNYQKLWLYIIISHICFVTYIFYENKTILSFILNYHFEIYAVLMLTCAFVLFKIVKYFQ